jgi:hypothetical protein
LLEEDEQNQYINFVNFKLQITNYELRIKNTDYKIQIKKWRDVYG